MGTFFVILTLIVAVIASRPLAGLVPAIPLPIVQIGIGAALAWPVSRGVHIALEPEVFLLSFIPPLLFADAWQAPKREFWQLRFPIAAMAFALVFFTIAAFGYAMHWLVPAVPLTVAFATAAVLSPTDAVAVSSIIDKDRLPPRLLHLLEGESLLNDASGLVMFRFAVAATLTGAFSLADASWSFLQAVVVGALAGLVSLKLAAKTLRLLRPVKAGAAESQVLVLLILPFLAYLLAEHLHASGVLAAVIAGLFVGRLRIMEQVIVSARVHATSVWQMLGFALNGAIFVFLGLQLPSIGRTVPPELAHHWLGPPYLIVLALTLCLMLLRYVFIAGSERLARLLSPRRQRPPAAFTVRMKAVVAVAGVRGAITLAGVLSLPLVLNDGSPFPARDLVIFLAGGVIVFWMVIASAVLPMLARGFAHDAQGGPSIELRRARLDAAKAAQSYLAQLPGGADADVGALPIDRAAAIEALTSTYRQRIDALEEGHGTQGNEPSTLKALADLQVACIEVERRTVRQLLLAGTINDHTSRVLFQEMNLSEALIQSKLKH